MPFLVRKKSPTDKLRETKAALSRWIQETQEELAVPAVPGQDELWRLGYRDCVTAWTAQRNLITWLETHPEAWTAALLEDQLRARFRRIDEIYTALQAFPSFDEDEDEFDHANMSETEREQRQQVTALHNEHYTLDRECDMLARFLDISDRRIHDVRHILLAHYEDEEFRQHSGKVEAAAHYHLIKSWFEGTGMLKTLSIPAYFSSWMTEYPSPFPSLV